MQDYTAYCTKALKAGISRSIWLDGSSPVLCAMTIMHVSLLITYKKGDSRKNYIQYLLSSAVQKENLSAAFQQH